MQRLTDKEFSGEIIAGEDPKNCGRYRVLIQELMYNIYDKEEGFIYCNNQVTNHRSTSSDNGIYGQYFPLYPGTKVIVKFNSEDFETGYIDRIISDHYENSMPLGIPTIDRDQYYQILRTIANDLIAVTHETSEIPKNGIHIYHKKDQTQIICDENGIHIYSKKDFDQRIDGTAFVKIDESVECIFSSDTTIQITGSTKIKIDSTCDITTVGDCRITSEANCHVKASSDCYIESDSDCNIKAGAMCSVSATGICNVKSEGACNIDGSIVNINCKLATPAQPAIKATEPSIVVDPKAPLIEFDEKKEISYDYI